jgi:2,3-bisphosphoglycerate-independent phosphoglycerate mutase
MSRYNAEFPFDVAFPPQSMGNVLADWLGSHGIKQCHIAGKFIWNRSRLQVSVLTSGCIETEKYAHVTFFFNGGVEKQYPGEDRHMIPSPKVITSFTAPEWMSLTRPGQ